MRRILALAGGALVALIAIGVVLVMLALSMLPALFAGALSFGDDCLSPGILTTGPANTDKRFFEQKENAARVYAQAMGLGLGEVGALAGITAGLGESKLQNGAVGDDLGPRRAKETGGSPDDMSTSRGMFQQQEAWVEPGRAWSGLKWTPALSRPWFSDINPTTGAKDIWNPWTGVKWAVRDPRMNHAQSSAMFFLGAHYDSREGLEDTPTYKAHANTPVDQVPDSAIADMAQEVQHASDDKYALYVQQARQFLADIKAGRLAVPTFEAPEPAIAKRATTKRTRAALAKVPGVTVTPVDATVAGDGLLLVGDSVMQGIQLNNKLPKQAFSGPLTVDAQRSMTLADVLTRPGTKTMGGTTVNLDQWRADIQNGPSRILVELGTNASGANTSEGVDRFMQLAGPGRQVYWFSMHYQPAKGFDSALLEAARKHPNLHIVDVSDVVTDYSQMHPDRATSQAMWAKAYKQMSGETAVPAQLISVQCGGEATSAFNDTIAPTGQYQRAAIVWARQHLSSVTNGDYVTWVSTDPDNEDFNCSTYTSAAYRAATNDTVQLVGYSDTQWQDTKNIQLIPASQAQPGDLLWQKTHPTKLTGHVLLIESLEGNGTVLHAANPTDGIVRGGLKDRGKFVALKDPSNPSRGADNIKYTDNWDEAYVGRVVVPTSA